MATALTWFFYYQNFFLIKVFTVIIFYYLAKMKHHNLFAWTNFSFFSLLILRKVFLSFFLTKIALDKVLFINVVRRNVTKSNTFSRFLNCTNGTKFATHLKWRMISFQIPFFRNYFSRYYCQKKQKCCKCYRTYFSTSVKRYFVKVPWNYYRKTVLIVILYYFRLQLSNACFHNSSIYLMKIKSFPITQEFKNASNLSKLNLYTMVF